MEGKLLQLVPARLAPRLTTSTQDHPNHGQNTNSTTRSKSRSAPQAPIVPFAGRGRTLGGAGPAPTPDPAPTPAPAPAPAPIRSSPVSERSDTLIVNDSDDDLSKENANIAFSFVFASETQDPRLTARLPSRPQDEPRAPAQPVVRHNLTQGSRLLNQNGSEKIKKVKGKLVKQLDAALSDGGYRQDALAKATGNAVRNLVGTVSTHRLCFNGGSLCVSVLTSIFCWRQSDWE